MRQMPCVCKLGSLPAGNDTSVQPTSLTRNMGVTRLDTVRFLSGSAHVEGAGHGCDRQCGEQGSIGSAAATSAATSAPAATGDGGAQTCCRAIATPHGLRPCAGRQDVGSAEAETCGAQGSRSAPSVQGAVASAAAAIYPLSNCGEIVPV